MCDGDYCMFCSQYTLLSDLGVYFCFLIIAGVKGIKWVIHFANEERHHMGMIIMILMDAQV